MDRYRKIDRVPGGGRETGTNEGDNGALGLLIPTTRVFLQLAHTKKSSLITEN